MRSKSCLCWSLKVDRDLYPRHVLCICDAAFKRRLSACRFSLSAWASETVFVAFETAEGVHDVLENGLLACPLRFTFLGRLELPVKVENMAAAWTLLVATHRH